ncbi:MAG: hypothetical protein R3B57_12625 [Phycisphaerales bacterium]
MDFLFANGAIWFSVPAILGTLVLLLELLLGQFGGHHADLDVDMDFGADVPADVAGADAGHAHDGGHPGAEFGWLSIQTIAAFAMGSGWMGLAAMRALEVQFGIAILIAIAAGFAVAWLMVTLMRTFLKLQRSDNISLDQTVGLEGTVYVMIPPTGQGRGRVTVVIDEHRREFDAVQDGPEVIPWNVRVRVIRVDRAGNAIVVGPLGA